MASGPAVAVPSLPATAWAPPSSPDLEAPANRQQAPAAYARRIATTRRSFSASLWGSAPARSQNRFASFTSATATRYPGPDVARGFMLLLIALANVPFWMLLLPRNPAPSGLDQAWLLLRGALVDSRSYPLFALLFGFGLATISRRRVEAKVQLAAVALPRNLDGALRAQRLEQAQAAGVVEARRLLRRRGWWMLLFGLVHGAMFPGEIIGTYALLAVLLAGVVAARRWRLMLAASTVVVLLNLGVFLQMGWVLQDPAGTALTAAGAVSAQLTLSPLALLQNLGQWAVGTVLTLLMSLALPAACLGVRLAESSLLRRPDLHRRVLVTGGLLALGVGAVGSLPFTLLLSGHFLPTWLGVLAPVVNGLTGFLGAVGWLSLLVAWAGPATEAPLRGARWLLAAVGRRSMTAYVGQTLVFLGVFSAWLALGVQGVSAVLAAVVAVGAWVVLALLCALMERSGWRRGPLEVLLRRAVAVSARRP